MRTLTALVLTFLLAAPCLADWVSVDVETAYLKGSPSLSNSLATLEIPRNYPLKIVRIEADFYQVQDYKSRKGWIEISATTQDKSVVVTQSSINIRSGPGTNHEVVFKAKEGAAFKVVSTKETWVEVLHESGKQGWIHRNLLWGI